MYIIAKTYYAIHVLYDLSACVWIFSVQVDNNGLTILYTTACVFVLQKRAACAFTICCAHAGFKLC